jgi:hypothetical protein
MDLLTGAVADALFAATVQQQDQRDALSGTVLATGIDLYQKGIFFLLLLNSAFQTFEVHTSEASSPPRREIQHVVVNPAKKTPQKSLL